MFTVKIVNTNVAETKKVGENREEVEGGERLVIPLRTLLLQADHVQFVRHRIESIEDWLFLAESVFKYFKSHRAEGMDVKTFFSQGGKVIEVIQLILITDKTQQDVILAAGCSVYIMNEQGVTVLTPDALLAIILCCRIIRHHAGFCDGAKYTVLRLATLSLVHLSLRTQTLRKHFQSQVTIQTVGRWPCLYIQARRPYLYEGLIPRTVADVIGHCGVCGHLCWRSDGHDLKCNRAKGHGNGKRVGSGIVGGRSWVP